MTFGTSVVFVGAVKVLEVVGIEDALSYCTRAAIVALLITWALSS